MANLFSRIDTSGSGSITQSQFTQTFQNMKRPAGFRAMGASAVFDPAGFFPIICMDRQIARRPPLRGTQNKKLT
jgi:hypothetical protein